MTLPFRRRPARYDNQPSGQAHPEVRGKYRGRWVLVPFVSLVCSDCQFVIEFRMNGLREPAHVHDSYPGRNRSEVPMWPATSQLSALGSQGGWPVKWMEGNMPRRRLTWSKWSASATVGYVREVRVRVAFVLSWLRSSYCLCCWLTEFYTLPRPSDSTMPST